jgi:hypothetical protein
MVGAPDTGVPGGVSDHPSLGVIDARITDARVDPCVVAAGDPPYPPHPLAQHELAVQAGLKAPRGATDDHVAPREDRQQRMAHRAHPVGDGMDAVEGNVERPGEARRHGVIDRDHAVRAWPHPPHSSQAIGGEDHRAVGAHRLGRLPVLTAGATAPGASAASRTTPAPASTHISAPAGSRNRGSPG